MFTLGQLGHWLLTSKMIRVTNYKHAMVEWRTTEWLLHLENSKFTCIRNLVLLLVNWHSFWPYVCQNIFVDHTTTFLSTEWWKMKQLKQAHQSVVGGGNLCLPFLLQLKRTKCGHFFVRHLFWFVRLPTPTIPRHLNYWLIVPFSLIEYCLSCNRGITAK